MWFGFGIIGLIIWIAIAFWPARVAGRKGYSFIGYFLLSLLFFPLSLIMAYMVQDRTSPAYAA
jgi:energy-coupling factor transporter transmembrane protein EcfT